MIIESTGVAEVAREFQLDGKADALAVAEKAHRGRRDAFGRRVCACAVEAEADTSMHGEFRTVIGDDFFGFDVEGLCKFADRCFPKSAVANDVRRHLDLWAVGKGIQSVVEGARGPFELEMEGACEEKRTQSQRQGEPFSFVREVQGSDDKC